MKDFIICHFKSLAHLLILSSLRFSHTMKPITTLTFIFLFFSTLAVSTTAGDKKLSLMVPASVQKAQRAKGRLTPFTNQPSSSGNNPPPAQDTPPAKKPKTDAPSSYNEHLDKASLAFDILHRHTFQDFGSLYHNNPMVGPAQQQQALDIQRANAAVQSGVLIAQDRKRVLERVRANQHGAEESWKRFKKTGDMFARRRRALHGLETMRALKRNSRNRR